MIKKGLAKLARPHPPWCRQFDLTKHSAPDSRIVRTKDSQHASTLTMTSTAPFRGYAAFSAKSRINRTIACGDCVMRSNQLIPAP